MSAQKTITTGIQERYVPIIDGKVVTYMTWTWRSDRNNYERRFRLSEKSLSRWAKLIGSVCVTGYPELMDAYEVAERAEQWAAEVLMEIMEQLEVEVRPVWFATKDGVPLSGAIPTQANNYGDCHPFHFDADVLQFGTEEEAIARAAHWHAFWSKEAINVNKSYGKNGGLQWVAIATDPRIEELSKKVKL